MSPSALPLQSFSIPADYPRIKLVHSFEELLETSFTDGVNALCWPRTLAGDFAEVIAHLPAGRGISTVRDSQLQRLPVSQAGRAAIDFLVQDRLLLREHGLDPVLDCVHGYPSHETSSAFRTDICSFHIDTATAEADTWLCTYHGRASEGLRNDQARRRIDLPESRAALLELFGGEDDDSFADYLSENFHDLHYTPLPGARPFSFGQGNLWRIAIDHPGSAVPACIHRAPEPVPGNPGCC